MKNQFLILMLILGVVGLNACGGGSGDNDSSGASAKNLSDIVITGTTNNPAIDNEFNLGAIAIYSNRTSEIITEQVSWRSSDSEIATVDDKGLVKPLKPGDVTFTASLLPISGTKTFTIQDSPRVTSITLSGVPAIMNQGQSYQLNIDAILALNNIEEKTTSNEYESFEMTSSDENIVTISESGKIDALNFGAVIVTVKAKNSQTTAILELTIEPSIVKIAVGKDKFIIDIGDQQVHATEVIATLSDESSQSVTSRVTWLISNTPTDDSFSAQVNPNVEIDASGIIVAKGSGVFYAKATLGDIRTENMAEIIIEEPLQVISLQDYGDELSVTWNSKQDALEYTLYWSNIAGIEAGADNVTAITVSEPEEIKLSDIDPSQAYYFRVSFLRAGELAHSALSHELEIQPLRGNWSHKPDLQSLRAHTAAVTYEDYVYIFGGMRINPETNNNEVSNITSEFNFVSYKTEEPWSNRQSMPVARLGMAACRYEDNIYLFGGADINNLSSNQILKYSPFENAWTDTGLASLPAAISHSSCQTVGDKIYIIGGKSSTSSVTNDVYIFDPLFESMELATAPSMLDARSHHASTLIENTLYVAGGLGANGTLDSFEVLDLNAAEQSGWVKLNRMGLAKSDFALVQVNDQLISLGGLDASNALLSDVESINWREPEASWQYEKPMPFANASFSHVIFNDSIYLYGGTPDAISSSSLLANTMSYDIALDSWYPTKNPTIPVTDFASAILNDQLIVSGGKPNTGTTEIVHAYDLPLSLWNGENSESPRNPSELANKRHAATSVVFRGSIYLIGGFNEAGNAVDIVERYDPSSNSWLFAGNLRQARAHACVVEVNNRIYAFGGSYLTPERDRHIIMPTYEFYEPVSQNWVSLGDMPFPTTGATCVNINNRIYLIGGMMTLENGFLQATNRLDSFNPATLQFSTEPTDMREARIKPAASVINGNIYIFGGFQEQLTSRKPLKSIERYIPHSNIAVLQTNATGTLKKLPVLPVLPANFDHLEAHNYRNKIVLFGSIVKEAESEGEVKQTQNSLLIFE